MDGASFPSGAPFSGFTGFSGFPNRFRGREIIFIGVGGRNISLKLNSDRLKQTRQTRETRGGAWPAGGQAVGEPASGLAGLEATQGRLERLELT
jgi:hypothetical protein